jgi:uncharacterized SAM-binding protein YcdF (DUF218 family)
VVLAGAAGIWAIGLVWFALGITIQPPPPTTRTDAIVVLTGGSERIESGLSLLAAGRARKLFVSGVYRGVTPLDLTRGSDISPHLVACCLVLGHVADNTEGNATETADWLRAERYGSLRLVTADYHMRRALLEFRRALPAGTVIIPDPVVPAARRDGKSAWRATAHVVLIEYLKYLAALARPWIGAEPRQASGSAIPAETRPTIEHHGVSQVADRL